ncbi:MAG TPA: class I SAM-dependent methyltransferase [Candidatus Dormibacteraeota bacterium]|nr:class I SAM-dependent methyltransferase [Candidatus Dormibacteraeota bacterium]
MTESVSFDRAADYYDRTRAVADSVMAQLIPLLVAEIPRGERCLEIGIGTGRIALPLVDEGVRVAGVDISSEMLRKLIAKRRGPWPQVAIADATRLPFPKATFGSAIASHVLHLIPGWRDAVTEITRVLRPGGTFMVARGGRDRIAWLASITSYFFRQAGDPPWPPGAATIDVVDAHMRELGIDVKPLPDLGLETEVSVEEVIGNLEAGYWAACWGIAPEVRAKAAAATREWAAREFGDLSASRQTVWESSTWHAYRLPE